MTRDEWKIEPKVAVYTPPRLSSPSVFTWVILVGFAAFFIQGFLSADISMARLTQGVGNLGSFFAQAWPPDTSRLMPIARAMLETVNMALVGVTFGVILSIPFALLCSVNTAPNLIVRWIARMIVATLRTIPDLIWALIFVVAVGLGPLAGILAIIMDTIGFCARFFSERFEEIAKGPSEALSATGAGKLSVIFGAIIPEALASLTATSLFGVEKAIRSAVVLGLVGAGGIGVELSTSMRMFRYDQALTIILVILVVVIAFEQVSSAIRKRVI
ncbi:phosphonate ABC transporter, permease protein PhnE [Halorhodospira abdelmalekii]|uniref:phosphonate ABC transporter, permease protein PhnE n=1 Tax=Halorhodospira abdelmalekii TaxID=421629 RepID=UPI001906F9F6|nr:phosphonate ABC transporter, permease protein PhnE [Halorhodospira abdelmalekii]MBK1735716.1 phosphonate ABC transporter, permease protein PhnE [Halorhodospira abdelmalekii]